MQQNKGWKGEVGTGGGKIRKIWKEHFEDLFNIDAQEQVAVHVFDGLLHVDDLVLCCVSGEALMGMMGRFIEVY